MKSHAFWAALTSVVAFAGVAPAQQTSVVDSMHNLSTSGPGAVRATTEEQVCIFCHTPHNATPIRPLWNRAMPVQAYSIYTSRSLDAKPGQPTGTSKMCLSCHDGTIALGAVASQTQPISLSGGVTTIPFGPGHLGTDLRDDHPISFRFDSSLAADDPKLISPNALPPQIRLDLNGELQCTSCHDAHSNAFGHFLVMPSENSELCLACHQMGSTNIVQHESCNACHQPHSAPSGPYLLKQARIAETCLSCHDGSVPGAKNIATDLAKPFAHETYSDVDPPEPFEAHVACADCHEPHTMMPGNAPAPDVPRNFGRVAGMNALGVSIGVASYEYEVCFRCHADSTTLQPWIGRWVVQNNTRLEFSSNAISFHPVEVPGKNSDVPSLLPGWTTASLVRCSDCHGSDASQGFGAKGVHGSRNPPLLVANYSTEDYTTENSEAYALCYMCHDRNSILGDESFSEHRKHIVEERTPCAACHDAHGVSSVQGTSSGNTHLINFATSIVFPLPGEAQPIYRDDMMGRGACFLSCHNEDHAPEIYPEN